MMSKSLFILLNKNINLNKHKTELKMENPIHGFREKNLVLQLLNLHSEYLKLETYLMESLCHVTSDVKFLNIPFFLSPLF